MEQDLKAMQISTTNEVEGGRVLYPIGRV